MNTIGNDNYRPGLKPPEPIRQGNGWLSSNIAQLMVFLNGLILTITAFATLSVFIGEIVQEGLENTTTEVQHHIMAGYDETERSLQALSALLTTPNNISLQEVGDYINQDISGADKFDQIYWVREKTEGTFVATPLLRKKEAPALFKTQESLMDFIRDNTRQAKKDIYISTALPKAEALDYGEEVKINDGRFALIKIQNNFRQSPNYLVGISRLSNVVKADWLKTKETVNDLQIIDSAADLTVYSYQRTSAAESSSSPYINIFSTLFAERPVDVKVALVIDSREAFLQKIPLLMLLFGITLTLIGTLYVRNNQTQSQKLAEMNKELAHKNFELNQEVTERERLNQVIQKSARENRAVINAVSDIIFEVSVDGTILFLNDAWNVVTGFELDRSIGRNLFDLLYVQDQEEQRHSFDQLVKGKKQSYRAFTRIRSADGSFRAVELAISMVRQDENKEMRVVGTITDVEERRRAERALSEAEKKYRAIVENAAGGIYQVTPEGQFLSANPAFAKIIGYDSPEEVLRDINNAQKQLYLDDQARSKFLREIATSDMPTNFEAQIARKDGKVLWVSEKVRPVRDDEDTLLFYEGSMEDVDQRRKAEIALKEAKIQSDLANRAKSEFLANMSHELRTPLNSVIGFSEIIKNETFGPLQQKEYKEYANDIFESGNKLLRVINEILDVSRIEAGERALNETAINIQDTVKSCLDLMAGKIKSSGMRIENKIQGSKLSFIGETQAVKQMILNLMSNAIKFSPPNGFIMLDAEIDSKGRLRISVTDTGIGLNDEELTKALSPFGQVDGEHKRAKSGTGLGLTLVKSLIELHGGELEIVSQKGIGTTATLIFPAKRVAHNAGQYKEVAKEKNTEYSEQTEES